MSKASIDMLFECVEWTPTGYVPFEENSLYATHSGVMKFGAIELKCYLLNDGQRVFDAEDVGKFLLFESSDDLDKA